MRVVAFVRSAFAKDDQFWTYVQFRTHVIAILAHVLRIVVAHSWEHTRHFVAHVFIAHNKTHNIASNTLQIGNIAVIEERVAVHTCAQLATAGQPGATHVQRLARCVHTDASRFTVLRTQLHLPDRQ